MNIDKIILQNTINRTLYLLAFLLFPQVSLGDRVTDVPPIQEEKNKKVIARTINEVLNKGRFELIDELFANELVEHDPHQQEGPSPKEAFIAAVKRFQLAFPDGIMTIDAQIAEGDFVATRWTKKGTHKGEFMGYAPTNREIIFTGMFYDRLENGKIIETWGTYDIYGLLQQIKGEK